MDSSQLNSDLNMLNEHSNLEPDKYENESPSDPSYVEGEDRILGNAEFDDADFRRASEADEVAPRNDQIILDQYQSGQQSFPIQGSLGIANANESTPRGLASSRQSPHESFDGSKGCVEHEDNFVS